MANNFYVYFLRRPDKPDQFEPEKSQPFYIGKGHNERFKEHRRLATLLSGKPGRKPLRIGIIHKLWRLGLDFEEDIAFKDLTEQEAFEIEQDAINAYGRRDNNTGCLTNLTNGGEGISGYICTDEHKKNISKGNKGKVRTPEVRERISNSLLGNCPWNKGIPHSPETLINISNALKGRPSHRKGKKHKPESIEKMRIVGLNRPAPSQETRDKNSKSNKGKKRSIETRKKISDAQIGEKNINMAGNIVMKKERLEVIMLKY